jgi:hypothetical protein
MCSIEKLMRLLDKRLRLDQELELFDHLDHCDSCRTAVYNLSHDRDKAFFVYRPYKFKQPKNKKLSVA